MRASGGCGCAVTSARSLAALCQPETRPSIRHALGHVRICKILQTSKQAYRVCVTLLTFDDNQITKVAQLHNALRSAYTEQSAY